MRYSAIICIIAALLITGCGGPPTGQPSDQTTSIKGDISKPVCEEFDADFVYSVIKIPIKKLEKSILGPEHGCQYKTKTMEEDNTSEFVAIYFENLSVETNKKGMEILERTLTTDSRIKMEHYIVWQTDTVVNGVYLVINPNRFVRVDRSSTKVIANDQNIELAAKVAEKLSGNLNLNIEKNPIDLSVKIDPNQDALVKSFWQSINDDKFSDAINMMDANQQTKDMWLANFQTIKSIGIEKVEEAFKEEWSSTRQVFKVALDVQVNEQGEQYGWSNGNNFRWVSLQRNNNVWQIHEIANNP